MHGNSFAASDAKPLRMCHVTDKQHPQGLLTLLIKVVKPDCSLNKRHDCSSCSTACLVTKARGAGLVLSHSTMAEVKRVEFGV